MKGFKKNTNSGDQACWIQAARKKGTDIPSELTEAECENQPFPHDYEYV